VNAYEIFRRLRAFQEGKPAPKGDTLHFPVAGDRSLLKLAFVRMGGESAPWGIAHRTGTGKLEIATVPEPRNRDQVADMMARFAPVLLAHLLHHEHSAVTADGHEHDLPHRQIWLPNASHAEMLHMLAYAYAFTRFGATERRRLLNALGRAGGWLFRESQRPGQIRVMDAAAALRESFSFPADDVRQQHTGYLLAWLETAGEREARLAAAAAAEQLTVATTLDPSFERDELQSLNERYNEARRDGDVATQRQAAEEIHDALAPELIRRIGLIERAIAALRGDPRHVNTGVALLENASREEHWFQYLRIEQGIHDDTDGPAIAPSPETDRQPATAASRYHVHEASEQLRFHVLLDDDAELQAEAVAIGEVVRGSIVEVRDEGDGSRRRPVWVIEDALDLPLRHRAGDRLCVAGLRNRWGSVRAIDVRPGGGRRIVLEIRGLKTRPHGTQGRRVPMASDPHLIGTSVTLLPMSGESISRTKSMRTWNRGTPGAWLTHHSRRSGESPTESPDNAPEAEA